MTSPTTLLAIALLAQPGQGIRPFISVSDSIVALTNVRVIDGTGAAPRTDQTIVMKGGVIQAVGGTGQVTIPAGARTLDLAGRTVMPGYVMLHEHLFYPSGGGGVYNEQGYSFRRLYLAGGVTTMRTGGNMAGYADLNIKKAIDEGAMLGTAHLCSVTFREAATLGIDDLEHGFVTASDFVADKKPDECPAGGAVQRSIVALDPTSASVRDLIAELVRRRVAITSTLTVFETFVASQPSAPAKALDAMLPEARRQYEQTRAALARSLDSTWSVSLRKEMQLEKMFADAGGLLVVGTDPTGFGGVIAGYSNQRALELLVRAGFTALEAIKVATLNGARYLGREARIGSIAAGKQADLIVVRGDPSARIGDVQNVELVFKQGVGYDSPKIFESVKGRVGLH